MDIREYINKINEVVREIQDNLPAQSLRIGFNQLALLKNRIINNGKLSDGSDTGDYSDTPVPAFFYYNKERRKGSAYDDLINGIRSGNIGQNKGQDGKSGYYASYKEWREVNNLPVDFKNYSFTGRTWQAIRPVLLLQSANRCVVGYTASGEEGKKIEYILGMEPTIFDASENEKDIAGQATSKWIQDILTNKL